MRLDNEASRPVADIGSILSQQPWLQRWEFGEEKRWKISINLFLRQTIWTTKLIKWESNSPKQGRYYGAVQLAALPLGASSCRAGTVNFTVVYCSQGCTRDTQYLRYLQPEIQELKAGCICRQRCRANETADLISLLRIEDHMSWPSKSIPIHSDLSFTQAWNMTQPWETVSY